jgi:hypothetical protein
LLTTQIPESMKTVPDKKFSDNAVLDEIRGKKKNNNMSKFFEEST